MKRLIVVLIVFFVVDLSAQSILNYTTSDGLITDFVECIDVDVNNNIWIGTSQGVQKYDGSSWTTYNTSSNSVIVSDNIKVIHATSSGDVWVGTDFGLNRFDGVNWFSYTTSNSDLISNQIKSIDEDINTGIMWFGTNLGVSSFDMSTWASFGVGDLHWSGVSSTAFDSNGDVWFSHLYGGITHYDGVQFIRYDTANGLLSQNVTSLIIDSQDNKWIGTGGGMSVLNDINTSFTHYTRMYLLPPPDTLNPVVEIDINSNGDIWVAIYVGYLAEGGVAFYDGSQWIDFDIIDGLAGPNVRDICIDNYDNAWVATSTGISKISHNTNTIFDSNSINFDIYPNPSSGIFNISMINNNCYIKIYNVLGELIFDKDLIGNEMVVNLDYLSNGIYYLVLYNQQYYLRKKITINK